MRFTTLRHRLLVAMGLPVIGCASAPPTTGNGTGSGTGPDGIGNALPEPQPGAACITDQLEETICGAVSDGTCGPMGDSLTSYGQSTIYVTQGTYGGHDAAFAEFWLDGDATKGYQDSLRVSNPGLPYESYCCYSHCTSLQVAASAQLDVPAGFHTEPSCIPAPSAGTEVPAEADPRCPAAVTLAGGLRPLESAGEGQCCYAVVVADPPPYEEHHNRGRAARVDGKPVHATVAARGEWCGDVVPALAALPAETRARLAAVWTEVGRMEHASIASFANLALRLLAAGAPPALIAATHRAALDEVEHARVSFALASSYAGAPVGPGAFAGAAQLDAGGGLEALALETFVDGCVGETVAAAEAGWAAGEARDPAVADALRRIAEDETRHAELAWAIVAWCVRTEPSLREPLRAALDVARAASPAAPAQADGLRAHGVLSSHDLARLRADVIRDVVEPCLSTL
jgi:hypothetical protein